MVRHRRGGYCYEQNGLMAYVLAQLGFDVDLLGGRVVWMNTSGTLPAMTHLTLAVTVPGVDGRYLVDVGFGGQTLSSPIRLEAEERARAKANTERRAATLRAAATGRPAEQPSPSWRGKTRPSAPAY